MPDSEQHAFLYSIQFVPVNNFSITSQRLFLYYCMLAGAYVAEVVPPLGLCSYCFVVTGSRETAVGRIKLAVMPAVLA